MQNKKIYENFPIWIPSVSCALCLAIYAIGTYVFLKLQILFAVLYVLFCVWIELRVLKDSCANCDYYGRTCGLGRGKLCALIFKKGSAGKFTEREISWKEIAPDFLVFILPLVGGIIYLIKDFKVPILALLVVLVILSLGGNALLRGALVCKHCKQRELGCPAEQLFGKRSRTKEV
jgi:hypothetical protein